MSSLTTHVLDTAFGKPAAGISVALERDGKIIASGVTDTDGRARDFQLKAGTLSPGEYQLVFDVAGYFAATRTKSFYRRISISFVVGDESHYHIPLLLSPFGYSTYRGS